MLGTLIHSSHRRPAANSSAAARHASKSRPQSHVRHPRPTRGGLVGAPARRVANPPRPQTVSSALAPGLHTPRAWCRSTHQSHSPQQQARHSRHALTGQGAPASLKHPSSAKLSARLSRSSADPDGQTWHRCRAEGTRISWHDVGDLANLPKPRPRLPPNTRIPPLPSPQNTRTEQSKQPGPPGHSGCASGSMAVQAAAVASAKSRDGPRAAPGGFGFFWFLRPKRGDPWQPWQPWHPRPSQKNSAPRRAEKAASILSNPARASRNGHPLGCWQICFGTKQNESARD